MPFPGPYLRGGNYAPRRTHHRDGGSAAATEPRLDSERKLQAEPVRGQDREPGSVRGQDHQAEPIRGEEALGTEERLLGT